MTEDLERRCALEGCDAVIEQPPDGGTARSYCSAAHRSQARRLRTLARSGSDASALIDSNVFHLVPARAISTRDAEAMPARPLLPSPRTRGPAKAGAADSVAPGRTSALQRRRRTVAVLGATAIVASGIAPSVGSSSQPSSTMPGAAATGVTQQPAVWAANAEVTLASLRSQLDMIEKTLATMPGQLRSTTAAPAVADLVQHRDMLGKQFFMLQSQLNTYYSAQRVSADLAATDGKLATIDSMLGRAQPSTSPEYAEAVRQLNEQHKIQHELRAAHSRALASLDASIGQAVATPLPDATDHTTAKIDKALASGEQPVPPPVNKRSAELSAVLPREVTDGERQETTTGAPPARRQVPSLVADDTADQDGSSTESPEADDAEPEPSPERRNSEPVRQPPEEVPFAPSRQSGPPAVEEFEDWSPSSDGSDSSQRSFERYLAEHTEYGPHGSIGRDEGPDFDGGPSRGDRRDGGPPPDRGGSDRGGSDRGGRPAWTQMS